MRRAALLGAVLAGAAFAAAPAPAAAPPSVAVLVAGRSSTFLAPRPLPIPAAKVKVGARTCAVAAGTPIAALEAARAAGGPSFAIRDYGACSNRAVDAGGLFVTRIGGEANRGRDGWVYRVGRRVGSTSGGDASGPFGDGRRLRTGQRLIWFWCRQSRAGGCQRTLELTLGSRRVARGAPLAVTVRGYDDQGRGEAVRGATVTVGASRATTGTSGKAILVAPSSAGVYLVGAKRSGLVQAFPEEVVVE